MKVLVEGLQRAELVNLVQHPDYYEAKVLKIDEKIKVTQDIKGLMRSISGLFEQFIKLNQKIPLEAVNATSSITEPDRFSDSGAVGESGCLFSVNPEAVL